MAGVPALSGEFFFDNMHPHPPVPRPFPSGVAALLTRGIILVHPQAEDSIVTENDDFNFHIIVKDQNMDELRSFVERVSDPTNSEYGKAMSASEVAEFTRPSAEDTAAVTAWLDAADGCSYSVDEFGRHIWVSCSVKAAEALLSTQIGHLINREQNQEVIRARDYTIPEEVSNAAATIFGLHGLPIPVKPALVSVRRLLVVLLCSAAKSLRLTAHSFVLR